MDVVSLGVAAAVDFLDGGVWWLCSEEYVISSMVGSTWLLSTCFLAGQPLELLHL